MKKEGDSFLHSKFCVLRSAFNAGVLPVTERGIFYIRTFMDEVQYSFNPGEGMSLLMTKDLAKGPGVASGKM